MGKDVIVALDFDSKEKTLAFLDRFKMMGFFVTARTAFVTSAADLGSAPKAAPPPWTLGQEILTSSQPTCSWASSFSQTSAYSATEKPLIFAITGL